MAGRFGHLALCQLPGAAEQAQPPLASREAPRGTMYFDNRRAHSCTPTQTIV